MRHYGSALCGLLALVFCSTVHAVPYGVNLLVNGNAEQGAASNPPGSAVPVPPWSGAFSFTAVAYGAPGGYPAATDPGPPDRRLKFFAGGNTNFASASQDINVGANVDDIDKGTVTVDIAGWLGGFGPDDDTATFELYFFDANGLTISSIKIGPITANDRLETTGLFYVAKTASLPAGTRRLHAILSMTRASGASNDGYADSLSVVLRRPFVVMTTADSGAGSLREGLRVGNTLTFDARAFASASAPHVINLAAPLLPIRADTSIIGPGAPVVTVRRSAAAGTPTFRIFQVTNGSSAMFGSAAGPALTLSGMTISDGIEPSEEGGGAIFNDGAELIIDRCALVRNIADATASGSASGGGAISNYNGAVTLTESTLSGNTSTFGGAIVNLATRANNSAPVSGTAAMSASNCTFSNNSASAGVDIADVAARTGLATVVLSACTLNGEIDQGFAAGALYVSSEDGNVRSNASVDLDNTIVAHADEAGNGSLLRSGSGATITSHGYNLSSASVDSTTLNQPTDQTGKDPKLGPLQDNGGPTLTHALLPNSPAIDKGNSGLANDQRGFSRPFDNPFVSNAGNSSDIGAVESGGESPTKLINISSRLQVGIGENVMIAGFIISGPDGLKKKVLLRGLGPSLNKSGVPNTLPDPSLRLSGSGLDVSNDNWQTDPGAGQIPAGFAPSNTKESAIVATLGPGNYTAVLQGSHGEVGNGLVEVYDLAQASPLQLANISTRGFVQTADNVLIGGFFVGGTGSAALAIRAIGPSLETKGVSNALQNPTLELHDANGNTTQNDDWQSGPNSDSIPLGLQPPDSRESVILTNLPPGGYTTIIRGRDNTTGVALIEVYAIN